MLTLRIVKNCRAADLLLFVFSRQSTTDWYTGLLVRVRKRRGSTDFSWQEVPCPAGAPRTQPGVLAPGISRRDSMRLFRELRLTRRKREPSTSSSSRTIPERAKNRVSVGDLLVLIDWSSSDDHALFTPGVSHPQSSNRFRFGIVLVLELVLGPFCPII
jgi:hypothetical protein